MIDALDNARAHVRTVYLGVLHREPESVTVRDQWAQHLLAAGLDQGIADLVDNNGEPQANLQQDFARDHLPGV